MWHFFALEFHGCGIVRISEEIGESIYTNVASHRRNAFELFFVLIHRINQIETHSSSFSCLCLPPSFLLLYTDWISFLFTTRRKCFLLQDRVFFKYRCPQFLSVYRDFLPIFLSLSLYSTSRNSTSRGKSLYLLLSLSFLLFCLPNQFLIYRLSNLFYLRCTKWFFRKETESEI